MSEIEKKMAETIKEGLPKLSEFDKMDAEYLEQLCAFLPM